MGSAGGGGLIRKGGSSAVVEWLLRALGGWLGDGLVGLGIWFQGNGMVGEWDGVVDD